MLGQLPVITTVAMITQYQVLVWMVAGLAATMAATKATETTRIHPQGVEAGSYIEWIDNSRQGFSGRNA